jgi:hypothetical protein
MLQRGRVRRRDAFEASAALLLAALLLCSVTPLCHALRVHHPYALRGSFQSSVALFGAPPLTIRDSTGLLVPAVPLHLCALPENREDMRGQVVLTLRGGGCSFSHKAMLAQAAGAIGLVVGNTENEIFNMADDGNGMQVGITVEMVSSDAFALLYQAVEDLGEEVLVSVGRKIGVGPYLI